MKIVSRNQPSPTLVSLGIQTVLTSNQRIEPGTRIAVKANKDTRSCWEWQRQRPYVALTAAAKKAGAWFQDRRDPAYVSKNGYRKAPVIGGIPLGVVVCTAVVTDCLPIGGADDYEDRASVRVDGECLLLSRGNYEQDGSPADSFDISDQLPYCDWTKRWAWLLADIEAATA